MEKTDLIDTIHEFIATGKPFLGICLGMQLLFEESTEFGKSLGLGLIEGKIEKLNANRANNIKLPHIGWTEVEQPQGVNWNRGLFSGIASGTSFYFVHSYAAFPKHKENELATSVYGDQEFCCAVNRNNVYGMQFHPEKSGEAGLKILKNLTEII